MDQMIDPMMRGPESACGLDGIESIAAGEVGGEAFRTAGDGMIVEIGGRYFDVGSGSADTDGDGVADSVTLADDRGLSIFSDIDGDGAVDHVTTVLFDGTYETWSATATVAPDGLGPENVGDTPMGVNGDPVAKPDNPLTWGVHEWERGERGRWA